MPQVIEQARDLLKGRLTELDEERGRLERAIASLSPNGTTPARRRRKGGTGRSRKGGTRADQALQLVKDNPGISAGDIAKRLRIKPNYMYRVLGDLEKAKLVTKKGRSYTAK